MPKRPKNEEELNDLEAIGVIRASGFVRKHVRSHKPIDFSTIRKIHKEIFKDARPDIAGEYRTENLRISGSDHRPPHYLKVPGMMKEAGADFETMIVDLEGCEGMINNEDDNSEELIECIDKVINAAAWLQHKVTSIHPFIEGNGRTARLATNIILQRYGLLGISIKIEKENKNKYRSSLAQIDKENDFEPLVGLIKEGLFDRNNGVRVKYYSEKKK